MRLIWHAPLGMRLHAHATQDETDACTAEAIALDAVREWRERAAANYPWKESTV